MRKVLILLALGSALSVNAQDGLEFTQKKESNVFNHLDAAVSMGSTGIGVDVSAPLGNSLQLRAGFDIMPRFHRTMNFGVQVGELKDDAKFNRLAGLLESFTGFRVDNSVDMIGVPTYHNFKLLVDWAPIRGNKNFYLTAGFYAGPSKIAKAYNSTEDMTTLMSVAIYNQMYEKAIERIPLLEIEMGGNTFAFPDDPYFKDLLKEKFLEYGRMGMPLGNYSHDIYDEQGNLLHAKGDTYMMEPDEVNMVRAKVAVNSFKPYLGFGYGGRLSRKSDKVRIGFDCGVLFWGGTPSIVTHDGTDLANDLEDVRGKVGDYVDIIKAFKVFPVLNLRITRKLF